VSALTFNGGRRDNGADGDNKGYGAFGRLGMRRDSQKRERSVVYFTASADYDHSNPNMSSREWSSYLRLLVPYGADTTAEMCVTAPNSRIGGVYANVSQNYTNLYSQNADGWVGVQANIGKGYLHLGGYLGRVTGRGTFQSTHWKIVSGGTLGPNGNLLQSSFTFPPAKYGKYYAVANADVDFGSISIHVNKTGNASSVGVIGFNAGGSAYTGDIYCNVIAWLTE
ncbi:phage minor structural protein, partial [Bifidobacterium sp. DSM 109959]|nr:phage minor structural protein [Bifidobacterium sp. DSM 109959]